MRIILLVLSLLLAGCSQDKLNDTLATPQEKAAASSFIVALQSGRLETVKASVEPQLYAETLAIARQLQPSIPKAANLHLVTVSVHTNSLNGVSQTQKALNYEFGAASKWAVIQIVLKTAPGSPQVVGWHAAPYDHQPTTGGDFALSGKSVTSYLWLAAMALSTITIVSALILIARTKGIRRRWLWAVGSAVGFGQFTLNWSTGAWSFRPLGFFLLGSAALKTSPFEAWMLSFSLPVVAVIFLLRRKALMAQPDNTSFD